MVNLLVRVIVSFDYKARVGSEREVRKGSSVLDKNQGKREARSHLRINIVVVVV